MGQLYRRRKFLASLDNSSYLTAYQSACNISQGFIDIAALLWTSRSDGRTVSQVMKHVIHWINPDPSRIADRENSKPPLWREFIVPLRIRFGDEAPAQAQKLQRQIFSVLEGQLGELTSGEAASYLSQMPGEDGEAYLKRFEIPTWRNILVAAHAVVGPHFRAPLCQFNTEDPESLQTEAQSTGLVEAVECAIRSHPEVAQNEDLQDPAALDALMLQVSLVISNWRSTQRSRASAASNPCRLPSPAALQQDLGEEVQQEVLEDLPAPLRTLSQDNPPSTVLVPASSGSILPHHRGQLQGPEDSPVPQRLLPLQEELSSDAQFLVTSENSPRCHRDQLRHEDPPQANRIPEIDPSPSEEEGDLSWDDDLPPLLRDRQAQRRQSQSDALQLKQKQKRQSQQQRNQPLPAQQVSPSTPAVKALKRKRSWKDSPRAQATSLQSRLPGEQQKQRRKDRAG